MANPSGTFSLYLPSVSEKCSKEFSSNYSIIRVTLNTELETLWLKPRIVETTASNLTNSTLTDKGGSEHQSYRGSTLVHGLMHWQQ